MAALPTPPDDDRIKPFNFYVGGLTFLALNDVHWQCEANAFGNFHECLKWMMRLCGDWDENTPETVAYATFLQDMFPNLDDEEAAAFRVLAEQFADRKGGETRVTVKQASFEKLFCDAYFLKKLAPVLLKHKERSAQPAPEDHQQNGPLVDGASS
jgi:hypothetical protein